MAHLDFHLIDWAAVAALMGLLVSLYGVFFSGRWDRN